MFAHKQKILIISENDIIFQAIADNIALFKGQCVTAKCTNDQTNQLQAVITFEDGAAAELYTAHNADFSFKILDNHKIIDVLIIADNIKLGTDELGLQLCRKMRAIANLVITFGPKESFSGAISLSMPFSLARFLEILIRHVKNSGLFCCVNGTWIYNENASSLSRDSDEVITFTDKENNIFKNLLLAPGNAIDKEALGIAVWQHNMLTESHTIETHLYKLKHKLPAGMLSISPLQYSLNLA
jgi:DNA-binding response OmpR family regulator